VFLFQTRWYVLVATCTANTCQHDHQYYIPCIHVRLYLVIVFQTDSSIYLRLSATSPFRKHGSNTIRINGIIMQNMSYCYCNSEKTCYSLWLPGETQVVPMYFVKDS